jgi:hypothetical protein
MKLWDRFITWRIESHKLSDDQRAAIAELERRMDHLETVEHAGTFRGKLFSMVFFGEEGRGNAHSVCVVHHNGEILWLPHDYLELE